MRLLHRSIFQRGQGVEGKIEDHHARFYEILMTCLRKYLVLKVKEFHQKLCKYIYLIEVGGQGDNQSGLQIDELKRLLSSKF